ncbi:acyltransferase domain-containing protein [uncultured Sphaerochaeta sp.]|uniref:acyltransferase domain-containing protein n=1 Tax=uncultured Sphaerochaeta sp. TaxID=886478 RepID=UPI002A0A7113|nr:acyltransferase domain-containing protein [uncultured Sphaerochaeta sp.]
MHAIDWKTFGTLTNIPQNLMQCLAEISLQLQDNVPVEALLAEGKQAIEEQNEKKAQAYIQKECALVDASLQDLFPLIFMAYVLPESVKLFEQKKVSRQILLDTFCDVGRWVAVYGRNHDRAYGCDRNRWLMHHFCAHLFQLGRLQYEIQTFEFPYSLYWSTDKQDFVCLAEHGIPVNLEGHICGTNGITEEKYRTFRKEDPTTIWANPIDLAQGTLKQERESFCKSSLKPLVVPHSPILALHIPEGPSLTPSVVAESIEQARAFSKEQNTHFCGVICDSWLLDPNLAGFLPPEGNICQFMQRFLKFPTLHAQPQIFERVLGPLAPQNPGSTLKLRLEKYLGKGGKVYTTGGFLSGWYPSQT